MITIRKLKTLKTGTLRRKTAVILQAFEQELRNGIRPDSRYLDDFLELTSAAFNTDETISPRALSIRNRTADLQSGELMRELNGLRHAILSVLGAEPADWDLSVTAAPVINGIQGEHETDGKREGVELYLDDIRSPFNLGSIFRTSEAFGVSMICLSPDCPSPEHQRARRSAMGCTELVEWRKCSAEDALIGKNVFALELGGTPIDDFEFPSRGIAVIGSEELGISPETRAAAERSCGLVSIPVYGNKGSINVSVAFGIMMQRWSESLHR